VPVGAAEAEQSFSTLRRLKLIIAPEPDPSEESDEVHEPATLSVSMAVLVEYEGMEGSCI